MRMYRVFLSEDEKIDRASLVISFVTVAMNESELEEIVHEMGFQDGYENPLNFDYAIEVTE